MPEFFPHFQPIVEISSGRITGYEALARQRLDDGTVRSAGPLFADPDIDQGFLLSLDREVRAKAIQQLESFPPDTYLNINISPVWIEQLADGQQLPTLEMIRDARIDPRRIYVEITELAGRPEAILNAVSLYREEGMRIAIDDFGAGYSEFTRLIALEPELIKLDMRFFKTAIQGGIAADAVQAIRFMAERIGSTILCEGVETEDEFHFAIDCGASLIQGWLFHKDSPEPIAPDSSVQKVTDLRHAYLDKKIAREKYHIKHHAAMLDNVHQLCTAWTEGGANLDLENLPHPPSSVLRFYVCRKDGEQLSPNYEFIQDRWHVNASYVGQNWSGRPYFAQLLATHECMPKREITSRIYRDRSSRELCQTLGFSLDGERIFLMDFLSEPEG